ncbi:addiction module protein [bacterium]|nr:addiction module protein [bacterium]MBU1614440.1 addiction module protein [bacterium]
MKQRVFDEVLSLPVDVRVSLVEKLLGSLNVPTQKEIDELWAREAERRVSQIDTGEAELVPGEQVFSRIREKYQK